MPGACVSMWNWGTWSSGDTFLPMSCCGSQQTFKKYYMINSLIGWRTHLIMKQGPLGLLVCTAWLLAWLEEALLAVGGVAEVAHFDLS